MTSMIMRAAVKSRVPGLRKYTPQYTYTDCLNYISRKQRVWLAARGITVPTNEVTHFVDAQNCHLDSQLRLCKRVLSGRIIEQGWDTVDESLVRPITELAVLDFARMRWIDGRDWSETNAVEWHLNNIRRSFPDPYKGTRSVDDVLRRLASLDKIFAEVRAKQHFSSRRELHFAFRAEGSPTVHLGPGITVLGPNGYWRFAIAALLEIPVLGVLGICHPTRLGAATAGVVP